jgi:hypothetical protein
MFTKPFVRWLVLAAALAAPVLLGACYQQLPGPTTSTQGNQPQGISVAGEGKVSVTPDVAILNLGVEVTAPSVDKAYQDANQAMDALMAALKAAGLSEKDYKTTQYNLNPIRRVTNGEEVLTGYRVNNVVSAKVRPVGSVGKLLTQVTATGGNNVRVQNIQFTLDDPGQLQWQLRDMAMSDAKGKAEQLAKLGGLKLGNPTYIQESGATPTPRLLDGTASAGLARGGDAPISPGELEVRLQVAVTYAAQP